MNSTEMNSTDIDRALREDQAITPSPDFSRRVMQAVSQHAQEREGIPFPWPRLAVGLGLCAVATVAAMIVGPPTVDPELVARALESSVGSRVTVWISSSLLGSYLLVRYSLRLAGYQR